MDGKVLQQLKQVIARTVGGEYKDRPIPDDLKLVGNVLDSMAVVSLIAAMEEEFGIAFEDEDLTAEAFETVSSLVEVVTRRMVG